jgi:hypothetical protein
MSFAHRGTLGHRVRVLLCVAALVVAGMSASAGVGSADEWGARALLLILLRPASFTTAPLIAAGELAHDKAWYEDRIFGPYGPLGFNRGRNVVEYYDALSRGKFTFNPAGTVEVVDSPLGGLVDNSSRRRNARQLAANAGFNYSDYDHNSCPVPPTEVGADPRE